MSERDQLRDRTMRRERPTLATHGIEVVHDHGAVHDHGPVETPHGVVKYVLWLLIPLIVATVLGMVWLWPRTDAPSLGHVEYATGVVEQIRPCEPAMADCQTVIAKVTTDEYRDQLAAFNLYAGNAAPVLEPGTPL
ncbi:MAG: hypothetical protein U0990_06945 [Candidatus Nanopelagicales bacterium]|nr:hypothetical protein [Candidatus Nanopelagicales bacterium]MDZ4249813.1 hypothetical protein [Candidatus Nanopelagicales bacterium]